MSVSGELDWELDAVAQRGHSSTATSAGAPLLDHDAFLVHAQLGYTWPMAMAPHLQFWVDYASGDDDAANAENNQFDTLFGVRRFDFGPTGIYGPFPRSNLYSPGLQLTLSPAQPLNLMIAHRYYWQAESMPGTARFMGRQSEARLRWRTPADWLLMELGGARLNGAGGRDDITYGYLQSTIAF